MPRAIVISVQFHDGRYHGLPEWPPSPARLFQALVSGAGLGGRLAGTASEALAWLEEREPPVVAVPATNNGQRFKLYLPNNDLDTVGRDPRRVAEIRGATKIIKPRLHDARVPWLYVWRFEASEDAERQAQSICAIAEGLYQFGRGVDMAWACGEVLNDDEVVTRLSQYPGYVYRPSNGSGSGTLDCPKRGSLAGLERRYAAGSHRFSATTHRTGTPRQLFSQPPRPRFAQVAYDSPPSRRLFELRETTAEAAFGAWPLVRVSRLVETLRDGAVERLKRALPDRHSEVERLIVGRKADGADAAPTGLRVRIVPLPTIGHPNADRKIRRVFVEVPAGCPLRAADVHWAFSNLDLVDRATGEVRDVVLAPSADESMLLRYGVGDRPVARVWRTVTPAALPESARRRRIDPAAMTAEAKGATERAAEQARATAAVSQALRYAEVRPGAELIRVQREPFESKGERVESFSPEMRFAKERLWHVEITFNAPIAGPLVIGDGRFLGLGVMAPVERVESIHAFTVENGLAPQQEPSVVTRALRRAVMSRVQQRLRPQMRLSAFFTGHESDGSPAQSERDPHLAFLVDSGGARLLIVAPHILARRDPTRDEVRHLRVLDEALAGFNDLRAGSAGRLSLRATSFDVATDPLSAPSRTWESVTPYQITRHTKRIGAAEALSADLRAECHRSGLPEPSVTPRELRGIPGIGLVGGARLTFEVAVEGPIVLGRSRHFGGGLFSGVAR